MKTVQLSEVAYISAGQAAPKESDFSNMGLPFIRAGHLESLLNGKFTSELPKISDAIAKDKKMKKILPGTVIFAKSGMSATLGRVYLNETEAYYVSHLASAYPNFDKLDSNYLKYFLSWFGVSHLIYDSAYPSIRLSDIKKLKIPLPPLEEQKRIASILDKADELRQKRKKTIEKLDELIQSIFLDMFGDPVTNPKGWKEKKLEDFISFLTSGSRGWAKYYSSAGELFLRIQNIKNGNLSLDDIQKVEAPDTKEAKRTKVKENDLLISITADLGRTAVVDRETAEQGAYINQHIALLRLKNCNPTYISCFLESSGGKLQFKKLDQVGVKSGLNFNSIKGLKILYPPLKQQNIFIKIKQKLEFLKHQQRIHLLKLTNLFDTMINSLLKQR